MGTTRYLTIIGLCITLAACSGTKSPQVATMQKSDKQLSCNQVQLEINEAEFYRKQAIDNKNPGFGAVISPLSYISTYMDAGKAQTAADDRIDYLNRIYEINRCDEPQVYAAATQPQPAPFQPAPIVNPAAYGAPVYYGYAQPHGMHMQPAAPYGGQMAYASPIAYQPDNAYYYTY